MGSFPPHISITGLSYWDDIFIFRYKIKDKREHACGCILCNVLAHGEGREGHIKSGFAVIGFVIVPPDWLDVVWSTFLVWKIGV